MRQNMSIQYRETNGATQHTSSFNILTSSSNILIRELEGPGCESCASMLRGTGAGWSESDLGESELGVVIEGCACLWPDCDFVNDRFSVWFIENGTYLSIYYELANFT
jgi:hypothetical protein